MIRKSSIIYKEILLLFYGTPIIYAISKVVGIQSLYAIKDVWMAFLCLQIFINYSLRKMTVDVKSLSLVLTYYGYTVLNSVVQMEDSYFWLISMREMVVTPLMLIIIGSYLFYEKVDYLEHARKALYFTTILTVAFSFVFSSVSYGSTNRLNSLWDREHEPAIIGAMLIVSSVAVLKRDKRRPSLTNLVIPILLGGFCIIMSRSRSGILALFFTLLYIFADKLNARNIIATIVLGIGGFFTIEYYSIITHRALNYNIGARLSQYTMAYNLIVSHPLFGIGVDKYGVLGNTTKVFSYNGLSTVTMDSDLIKYVVNLGIVFALLYFLLLRKIYHRLKKVDRYSFIFIVFGLAIGAVTGKLSSYPMNQYFFPIIGYIVLARNRFGETLQSPVELLSKRYKTTFISVPGE